MRNRLFSGILGCFLLTLSPIVCTAASEDTLTFEYPYKQDETQVKDFQCEYTIDGWKFRDEVIVHKNGRIEINVFCMEASDNKLDYYLTVYTGKNSDNANKDANKYVVCGDEVGFIDAKSYYKGYNSAFTQQPIPTNPDRFVIINQGKQPEAYTIGDEEPEFTIYLFMTKDALSREHKVYYATAPDNYRVIRHVISFHDIITPGELFTSDNFNHKVIKIPAIMPTYDELLKEAYIMNTQLLTADFHRSGEKDIEIQDLKAERDELQTKVDELQNEKSKLEKQVENYKFERHDVDGDGQFSMADAVMVFRTLAEVDTPSKE